MLENDITTAIIGAAIDIHRQLGPGLLESVYERVLQFELQERGLRVCRQEGIPLSWKTLTIYEAFRADLIVENAVIVEIKSSENPSKLYAKQLLTYLRLSGKHLGLVLNFGQERLKDGIERVINGRIEVRAANTSNAYSSSDRDGPFNE